MNSSTIGAGGGIIGKVISNPIEFGHPVDVVFGTKALSRRQQNILDKLPDYGSRAVVKKKDVSMLDLSALTAKTGNEFAMFTCERERLVIRDDIETVPIRSDDAIKLREAGYRWSGHTHVGITNADLVASKGDIEILEAFKQENSVIYNSLGMHKKIKEE